jgi:hypothetical protein
MNRGLSLATALAVTLVRRMHWRVSTLFASRRKMGNQAGFNLSDDGKAGCWLVNRPLHRLQVFGAAFGGRAGKHGRRIASPSAKSAKGPLP